MQIASFSLRSKKSRWIEAEARNGLYMKWFFTKLNMLFKSINYIYVSPTV